MGQSSYLYGTTNKMLSLTYTLNALEIEQGRVRRYLDALIQNLEDTFTCSNSCSPRGLEQLLNQIKLVHMHSSWRRLEVHVLPEIGDASESVALLLAELDSIRLLGLELYRSSRDQLRMAIEGKKADMQLLARTTRLYCSTIQTLLAKEEQQLFNEAFAVVEEEKWFSIARRFIQIDKEMLEFEKMGEVNLKYYSKPIALSGFGCKSEVKSFSFPAEKSESSALAAPKDDVEGRPQPRRAS